MLLYKSLEIKNRNFCHKQKKAGNKSEKTKHFYMKYEEKRPQNVAKKIQKK